MWFSIVDSLCIEHISLFYFYMKKCIFCFTEFAADSLELVLQEPEGDTPLEVILRVVRNGGSTGVVGVDLSVTTSDGQPASDDVLPTGGTLLFVSNLDEQNFTITVLPDNLPEIDEVRTDLSCMSCDTCIFIT